MGDLFSAPPKPKMPPPGPTSTDIAKKLMPGAKSDAAARTGGGISPEFLQNVLGQQTGAAPGELDVLGDIRKSLGG